MSSVLRCVWCNGVFEHDADCTRPLTYVRRRAALWDVMRETQRGDDLIVQCLGRHSARYLAVEHAARLLDVELDEVDVRD